MPPFKAKNKNRSRFLGSTGGQRFLFFATGCCFGARPYTPSRRSLLPCAGLLGCTCTCILPNPSPELAPLPFGFVLFFGPPLSPCPLDLWLFWGLLLFSNQATYFQFVAGSWLASSAQLRSLRASRSFGSRFFMAGVHSHVAFVWLGNPKRSMTRVSKDMFV